MIVWLAAGCVVPTTRYYVSPAAAPRITPVLMRDRLSAMMTFECPPLLASRDSVHGAVGIRLAVDSTGTVQRASMRRGSGNAAFDDVLGGLAAGLQLAAPAHGATTAAEDRTLVVFYWCSRTVADVRLQVDST